MISALDSGVGLVLVVMEQLPPSAWANEIGWGSRVLWGGR